MAVENIGSNMKEREDAFVSALDSVEEYLLLRQQLADALRKGLFSMAQAKYQKGPFGQPQYDMEMQATAVVDVYDEDDSMYSRFELRTRRPGGGGGSSSGNPAAKSEGADAEGGADGPVSSSNGQQQQADDESLDRQGASEPGECSSSSGGAGRVGSKARGPRDPLHWFGVLVPQSLREAQKDFQKAVALCVELANVSQRMLAASDELAGDASDAGSEIG